MVTIIINLLVTLVVAAVGAYLGIKYYYNTTVEVEYPLEPPPEPHQIKHKPIRTVKRRRNAEEVRKELVEAHNDWLYHMPTPME